MKLDKNLQKVGNQFKKAGNQVGKFFGKGSQGSKLLGDVSNGLHDVGNVLNKASNIGNQVLNNPITKAVIASNPELAPLYAGAKGVNKLIGLGGQGSNQLADATKQKNYHGNVQQVSNQVLQRAKSLQQTGQSASRVQFA